LTAEQLEASRAERMRLNGNGALTLEDARTWIEETGLCLFLPKRQFATSIAPSFVEAVAGQRNATPDPKQIALAEELLVRLETDGVAVRLNLLGLPGEQPDFVVAAWVLPYVYALRGDRDWRRSPQLTGSRQVSQLAVQAYKQLELGDTTIAKLTHALGREVTEGAVLRAITELWQQLRIIPVVSAPGHAAQWQLLRTRFQKAIAEGASTSQVTAISVLASIYLQAVIAASMEEVELFLAALTARSKVREVLRGLVATRQVHTLSLGHAPHFYVAGTLPEFAVAPTLYSSSSMSASAYFLHSHEHEQDMPEPAAHLPAQAAAPAPMAPRKAAEPHTPRVAAARKPATGGKAASARPHFSRPATHSRDRKPAQSSTSSRPVRRASPEARTTGARPAGARPAGARTATGTRPASGARWAPNAGKSANGTRKAAHTSTGSGNGARSSGSASRPASGARSAKSAAPAWSQRNGHGNGTKTASKPSGSARSSSLSRSGSAPRKDARPDARSSSSRKPALAAGTKAGNSKRFGFTAPPKPSAKKRG
jgi:23S rRNA pseudouridine2605 synthase